MSLKEVLKSDNSNKNVVLYARESKASGLLFRGYGDYLIKKYLNVETYQILSDYPDKTDFYIDLEKYSLKDLSTEDFKIINEVLDFESIIKNDRTFRISLSYFDASQLIYSTAKYLIEFFKENKVDILLTHMVDCYTVDLLTRIARYFDVIIIPYCGSPFNEDYVVITERGEGHDLRDPSEIEVDNFITFLKEKTSNHFVKSRKAVNLNVAKYYFIYKIKYLWHYLILHKLCGKNEYRYLMTTSETYPRSIMNILSIRKYFVQDLKLLPPLSKNKTVYIPLHYHPEATTEYWVNNQKYLTYYPSLIKNIKSYIERGYTVLVKEHTAMYMMRDRKIYQDLTSLPNTYLISPYVTTYDILEFAEYTILWTGTTGVEAIMTDKKVILTETETYYSNGKLAYIGDEENARLFSETEKRELARTILATLLPLNL